MDKIEFLNKLKEITPQEINDIIEAKGKKPKLHRPFIIIDQKNIKLKHN